MKFTNLIPLLSIVFSYPSPCFPTNLLENQEQAHATKSVSKSLERASIEQIEALLTEGHKKADAHIISEAYRAFLKLEYSEQTWQSLKDALKAFQWSSQKTAKEAVAGHLFYPKNVNDILDSPYTEACLKRLDMLWAFAFSADFQHPLGKYYLAFILDSTRQDFFVNERPNFLRQLYDDAFNDLKIEATKGHPEACYILGCNHEEYLIVHILERNSKKALELHLKGRDAKNRYHALLTRPHTGKDAPTIQEFIAMGEDYPPAYVNAAMRESDWDKKKTYLQYAIEKGYAKALIDLGYLYKLKRDLTSAEAYFVQAGEKGVSAGYRELGRLILGEEYNPSIYAVREKFSTLSSNDIEKGINALKRAVEEGKNPQACDDLADVYLGLYEFDKKKNKQYYEKFYYALLEGIKLGSGKAHSKMHHYFKKQHLEMIKKYGPPPQADLYVTFENFLTQKAS